MADRRNSTGRTLSSSSWLSAHHRAKLAERIRFAKTLVALDPASVVDLGCATGLWLDLLDSILPTTCEFVGIDSDSEALSEAGRRAATWQRPFRFINCDISANCDQVPAADVTLMFNMLPYMADFSGIIDRLHSDGRIRRLVIRQYDGATIRLGPLPASDRQLIDSSLFASLGASSEFGHYAMDAVLSLAQNSKMTFESLGFELTERHAPFPEEFQEYLDGTVEWMLSHASDAARDLLQYHITRGFPTYYVAVDLVAVLSGQG